MPRGPIGPRRQNSVFSFMLTSFQNPNARSLHEGIDFVSASVLVGKRPPITLSMKALGNPASGIYQVNLSIPNVEIEPHEIVTFVYGIVNSRHGQPTLEEKMKATLEGEAERAVEVGIKTLGTVIGDNLGGELLTLVAAQAIASVNGV